MKARIPLHSIRRSLLAALLVGSAFATIQCGPPPVDATAPQRTEKVNAFNDLYKACNKDFDSCSPENKKKLLDIYGGSELNARCGFYAAKFGPGGVPQFKASLQAKGIK